MSQPKISMIAAIAEKDRGIGKDNELLFHIPEDLKRFMDITSGHVIIMGRKTYESIGRPLSNRINVVVSRDTSYKATGCVVKPTLETALSYARIKEKEEIFIIGGGQLYKQVLPLAEKLYLTLVQGKFEADTHFPDYSEFKKVTELGKGRHKELEYTFLEIEK